MRSYGSVEAESGEREKEEERPERRERQQAEHLGVHGEHEARAALHHVRHCDPEARGQMPEHRECHEAAEDRREHVHYGQSDQISAERSDIQLVRSLVASTTVNLSNSTV